MKISTRARYGLRFMIELTTYYGKGPLFLKSIARSQEISEKYLSQIVIDLKAAHLLTGSRGAHGGYVLAKTPDEINAYDIVNALEGDLTLIDCIGNSAVCSRSSQCVSQEVWHRLGQAMAESLKAITLADLLKRQQEKSREFVMYYI